MGVAPREGCPVGREEGKDQRQCPEEGRSMWRPGEVPGKATQTEQVGRQEEVGGEWSHGSPVRREGRGWVPRGSGTWMWGGTLQQAATGSVAQEEGQPRR